METEQQKAEAYVRTQIPELMELTSGCRIGWEYPPFRAIYFGEVMYEAEEAKEIIVLTNSYVKKSIAKANLHTIYGHPIQLQHWLRVLGMVHWNYIVSVVVESNGAIVVVESDGNGDTSKRFKTQMLFNLTTGKPATEADYKAFNDIVGN